MLWFESLSFNENNNFPPNGTPGPHSKKIIDFYSFFSKISFIALD